MNKTHPAFVVTGRMRCSRIGLIFQTPYRYYINPIFTSVSIRTYSCKHHQEGRLFHAFRINFTCKFF